MSGSFTVDSNLTPVQYSFTAADDGLEESTETMHFIVIETGQSVSTTISDAPTATMTAVGSNTGTTETRVFTVTITGNEGDTYSWGLSGDGVELADLDTSGSYDGMTGSGTLDATGTVDITWKFVADNVTEQEYVTWTLNETGQQITWFVQDRNTF